MTAPYGEKVKAYLRKRTRSLRGEEEYPNDRVGYGRLTVVGTGERILEKLTFDIVGGAKRKHL